MRILISLSVAIICTGAFAQDDDFLPSYVEAELGGPSGGPVEDKDTLRPFNKAMFVVNDKLYFWVLKPLGQGWGKVAPQSARQRVKNFFSNLRAPGRTVNAALQGKWQKAGTEVERFAVNTTIGVLGFDDAATKRGTPAPSPEDLGQTLARYRIGAGWYIVWPIFGPSNIRDTLGMFGDRMLDPVTYTGDASFPIGLSETINRTSLQIGRYEQLKRDALNPYSFLRDLYQQRRASQIKK
jgi:phospholipid-binding lipoprotein MlaA